jgi:hypothetical protein
VNECDGHKNDGPGKKACHSQANITAAQLHAFEEERDHYKGQVQKCHIEACNLSPNHSLSKY